MKLCDEDLSSESRFIPPSHTDLEKKETVITQLFNFAELKSTTDANLLGDQKFPGINARTCSDTINGKDLCDSIVDGLNDL